MRIMIVTESYPPYCFGGYGLSCKDVADKLREKGHEVLILTASGERIREKKAHNTYRILNYYKEDGHSAGYILPLLKSAYIQHTNYEATLKLIKLFGPEIAYIWRLAHVSPTPVFASQRQKIPIVFQLGDIWLIGIKQAVRDLNEHSSFRDYLKRTITRMDLHSIEHSHFIAVSRYMKSQYVQAGFPESHIKVVYNGISSDTVLNHNCISEKKDEIRLLYVGRLVETKGVHTAIMALAYLVNTFRYRKMELDIVGVGDEQYKAYLITLANDLGVKDSVRFMGPLPRKQVICLYDKYDILLVPSILNESFGLVAIEAMARGIPVIASERCGGLMEIIRNGQNGLLFPKHDYLKLSECVNSVLSDQLLRERIVKNAIETVKQKFTLERQCNEIEEYLGLAARLS